MSSYNNKYYPKRPVKSFRDLEVYQKLLAVSVAIAKRITPEVKEVSTSGVEVKLVAMALDLPVKIATAHSLRFGDQTRAIETLEEVMLNCNILVVYLEQYRDLKQGNLQSEDNGNDGSGTDIFFEEQIKNLLTVRMKILHLQRSWQKFAKEYANK